MPSIDIHDHRLTDHERHVMKNAAERLGLETKPAARLMKLPPGTVLPDDPSTWPSKWNTASAAAFPDVL
ncbi:MAG: hypothetical protein HQL39_18610 [Alphaproteobacteria bacterium]|nr:hypothetical protein [Alphaproteobacteria bacterium]MBF0375410.1 hypothetical protein [Alphaproteobacteria bacterium]MBF0379335.1 hypothetical protein [Desulfamplus sp.]